MSADRLREAARVLRERAEAATPGPWLHIPASVCGPGTLGGGMTGDPEEHVYMGNQHPPEDAAYIATMHPGVGLALADWLDTAANNAERNGWMAGYTEAMRGTSAVRIADLILGGAA